jgi:hypothetical protein
MNGGVTLIGGTVIRPDTPSDLAIDLAISRVTVAALKAKAHLLPDAEDRSSAALLRDAFTRDLALANPSLTPSDSSQSGSNPSQIQEILLTLAPVNSRFKKADAALLAKLLPRLEEISHSSALSEEAASELLEGLIQLSARKDSVEAAALPPPLL